MIFSTSNSSCEVKYQDSAGRVAPGKSGLDQSQLDKKKISIVSMILPDELRYDRHIPVVHCAAGRHWS